MAEATLNREEGRDLEPPVRPHGLGRLLDSTLERRVAELLESASVRLNGSERHDFQLRDPRALRRLLLDSGLGLGETYMDGAWDCASLDELVCRMIRAGVDRRVPYFSRPLLRAASLALNLQSPARAAQVAHAHYDLDPELFRRMLGPTMAYTCGYWPNARTLEEAQTAKHELICRKLALKPGMRVLDIGCGFGAFMRHAAERHGARCVGYSVSESQTRVGRELCAGLDVEFTLRDYREISGKFDRIVSIEMLEAVGHRNHRAFMEVAERSLADDGLFLLQTMGNHRTKTQLDPWFHKYIFPNGLIPSAAQLTKACEGLLSIEDWHCFGDDYDRTLLEWNARFQAAWPELKGRVSAGGVDGERFRRMWEFYLLSFAGAFRARSIRLWQLLLAKPGRAPAPARPST